MHASDDNVHAAHVIASLLLFQHPDSAMHSEKSADESVADRSLA
jgi:hypothetical protein